MDEKPGETEEEVKGELRELKKKIDQMKLKSHLTKNEIEAEKESKLHIGFLNSQLNNEVVEQKGIIENLSRDKQQLMNTIAQLQETKQES